MSRHCRLTDRWTGYCNVCDKAVNGIVISGSPNFFIDGLQQARVCDRVISDCGHMGVIITGSPDTSNATADARVGDMVSGDVVGVLISGSQDVETV